MADQISVVPHNHQHFTGTISSAEQLLCDDNNEEMRGDNSLLDDVVNGMIEEMSGDVAGNHGAKFPQLWENVCNETAEFADLPPPQAFGNPTRIPVWPVPPSPYSCSCCQTLREIFHVNGMIFLFFLFFQFQINYFRNILTGSQVLKLGIHGRLGFISHAVLERYDTKFSSHNHEYYMFE